MGQDNTKHIQITEILVTTHWIICGEIEAAAITQLLYLPTKGCPNSSSEKWKAALQLYTNLNAFCMGSIMV